MKKIIHFHPNGHYSNKFIDPLQTIEKKLGFTSIIVNDINNSVRNLQIEYVFKKNNFFKYPLHFIQLILFIYRAKPDVIFSHNSISSLTPMLVSRFLFVKNIIYFNHGTPFLGHKGITRLILYLIEKLNCLLSTKIITVSHAMKNELQKITTKKIFLIFNGSASGIDLNQFKKIEKNKLVIKKQYNITQDNKIILFVGRPNRRKGFYDIIEIWKKYFEFRSDYTLILLGITENDVLKLYKKIPHNLKALSFTHKPEIFYILADYLFMNSYHEGLNYSVIEALLSKTIVISNNILGVSEVINHYVNGFLIDNNFHAGFFNAVMVCEKSKALKKSITDIGLLSVKKYDRKNFFK